MVASSFPKLAIQRLVSPTLSLDLITPTNKVIKTRGKDRSVLGTFWDNVDAVVLKAHDAIVVEDLDMKLRSLSPAIESTNWLILGRMRLSFEQALLRFVKSTPILHLLLFFYTITTFASNLGKKPPL